MRGLKVANGQKTPPGLSLQTSKRCFRSPAARDHVVRSYVPPTHALWVYPLTPCNKRCPRANKSSARCPTFSRSGARWSIWLRPRSRFFGGHVSFNAFALLYTSDPIRKPSHLTIIAQRDCSIRHYLSWATRPQSLLPSSPSMHLVTTFSFPTVPVYTPVRRQH